MMISHLVEQLAVEGSGAFSKTLLKQVIKDDAFWKTEKYKEMVFENLTGMERFGPSDIFAFVEEQVKETIHSMIEGVSSLVEDSDVLDQGFDFISGSMEEVADVMSDMGIDLPEGLDFLPGASEIILGVRLLLDIRAVNNEFVGIPGDKKKNIMAAKALVTISKFGVTATLTTAGSFAGGAAGAHFVGIGALVGAPIGAFAGGMAARQINKSIAPHAQEIAYALLDLNKEDLFYFKNKVRIDGVGQRLFNMKNRLKTETY